MEEEFIDQEFEAQKKKIQEAAARLERGEAKTYSIEEVEAILEATIQRVEAEGLTRRNR